MRHVRLTTLAALAVLILAGCRSGSWTLPGRVGAAATPPTSSAPPAAPDNQLLVQGVDGNIYLASPDGAQRFALTDDATASRFYSQPGWSADGERVAWAKIDPRGSALATSRFDGSERSEVRVPFAPFYIAWSPAGDRLAYLSNWTVVDEPTIALRLAEVGGAASQVETLATGRPFYFAWAPDGERLLTHIGNERVEVQAITGAQTPVVMSGGAFRAPQWGADGRSLAFALADDSRQRLVIAGLDGAAPAEITDFDGQITFALSPDSARLAYVATPRTSQTSTLGPLYVVDLATQATRAITDLPVVAFAWSPDGQKLAYLTLERVRNRVGLRWNVWDGSRRFPLSAFVPTRTFLEDYLPFFDQYAQSHRVWSPASDALVFTGALADGRSGVWVQQVGEDQAPRLVGPGLVASWSPR